MPESYGSAIWLMIVFIIMCIILTSCGTARHYSPAPKYEGYSLEQPT